MNRQFFTCTCGDCSHNLALSYDPNFDINQDLDYLYIHVHLTQTNNIFKRVWLAIKYILNMESEPWGHYTEVILDKSQTDKLVEFIQTIKHYGSSIH